MGRRRPLLPGFAGGRAQRRASWRYGAPELLRVLLAARPVNVDDGRRAAALRRTEIRVAVITSARLRSGPRACSGRPRRRLPPGGHGCPQGATGAQQTAAKMRQVGPRPGITARRLFVLKRGRCPRKPALEGPPPSGISERIVAPEMTLDMGHAPGYRSRKSLARRTSFGRDAAEVAQRPLGGLKARARGLERRPGPQRHGHDQPGRCHHRLGAAGSRGRRRAGLRRRTGADPPAVILGASTTATRSSATADATLLARGQRWDQLFARGHERAQPGCERAVRGCCAGAGKHTPAFSRARTSTADQGRGRGRRLGRESRRGCACGGPDRHAPG